MHWKIALCSLSIGTSWAAPARAASTSNGPATTSDSLLASSTRLPARAAASVDGNPAAPTIAAITASTSGLDAHSARAPAPQRTSVAEPAVRRAAARRSADAGDSSTAMAG
jgi:K+-transporting ATPase c subunit